MGQGYPVRMAAVAVLAAVVVWLAGRSLFPAGSDDARILISGLTGFFAGLAVAIGWRGWLPAVAGGYTAALVATVAAGIVLSHGADYPRVVGVLLFAGTSIAALVAAGYRIWRLDESVGFESDWGGLGHGLGGWRLTASTTFLLVGLAAGAVAVMLALGPAK